MSTENVTTGYVARYIVPIHLQSMFKEYLRISGAPHRQDYFIACAIFTVSGSAGRHREFQKFLQDCTREKRTLFITNFKLDASLEEMRLWGLFPLVEKKGLIFTRISIIAETKVLDRLERYLSRRYLL
jgi:hypothetical protein